MNRPKRKADKTTNRTRVISPYRDARFMRDFEASLADRSSHSLDPTSVCKVPMIYPSIPAPTLNPLEASKRVKKPAPIPLSAMASPSPSGSPGRVRSKVAPWWRGGFYLNEPLRRFRNPAQWRDTSDILRCHYAHMSLLELGPVHSFTVRLRDDIEAKARQQPSPLVWLQQRIKSELRKVLDRPVQFLLVIEEEKRRLHCHGEFQVSANEVTAARAALRKACGPWKKAPQHQTKTEADPDDGWAGYVSKDFWKTTPGMRAALAPFKTNIKVTFPGSALSITAGLNARATALYAKHRALVIN
jgi:hypothetical protein